MSDWINAVHACVIGAIALADLFVELIANHVETRRDARARRKAAQS